jgi:hypothetical protein
LAVTRPVVAVEAASRNAPIIYVSKLSRSVAGLRRRTKIGCARAGATSIVRTVASIMS